jgi:hypothetical protein
VRELNSPAVQAFLPPHLALLARKSSARKAASAKIAKIPFALSSHIARIYYPTDDLKASA